MKEKKDILLRVIPIILAIVVIGLTSIFNEFSNYKTANITISILLAAMIFINGVKDIKNNKSRSGRIGIIISILIIIEAFYKLFMVID